MRIMNVSPSPEAESLQGVLERLADKIDELGVWRQTWNEISKPYIIRYFESFEPSPPEEDWDDRNALYAT